MRRLLIAVVLFAGYAAALSRTDLRIEGALVAAALITPLVWLGVSMMIAGRVMLRAAGADDHDVAKFLRAGGQSRVVTGIVLIVIANAGLLVVMSTMASL